MINIDFIQLFIFDTTSRALDGYLRNILTPDISNINSSTSDHVVKKFLFEESDVEKSRVVMPSQTRHFNLGPLKSGVEDLV